MATKEATKATKVFDWIESGLSSIDPIELSDYQTMEEIAEVVAEVDARKAMYFSAAKQYKTATISKLIAAHNVASDIFTRYRKPSEVTVNDSILYVYPVAKKSDLMPRSTGKVSIGVQTEVYSILNAKDDQGNVKDISCVVDGEEFKMNTQELSLFVGHVHLVVRFMEYYSRCCVKPKNLLANTRKKILRLGTFEAVKNCLKVYQDGSLVVELVDKESVDGKIVEVDETNKAEVSEKRESLKFWSLNPTETADLIGSILQDAMNATARKDEDRKWDKKQDAEGNDLPCPITTWEDFRTKWGIMPDNTQDYKKYYETMRDFLKEKRDQFPDELWNSLVKLNLAPSDTL